MKKIIALIIAAALCLSLCACGGGGKYKSFKTLGECEYSIVLRSGDSNYYYIDAALRELSADGTVENLSRQWLGKDNAVSFKSDDTALDQFEYIAPREFIIGCDLDSYPMCIQNADGSYTGFDVELARAVCKLLGWSLTIQPIASADAFIELNSGNIDCAWGGVSVDTTSDKFTVVNTYMSTDIVLAGLSQSSIFLRGKTLSIGTSQVYLDLLNENERTKNKLGQITRAQGTTADFFSSLDNNECDLIITTSCAVTYRNNH